MALFHVNRYMGTDDSPPESKSSGDILLQKLHERAKAREEQRQQGTHKPSKSSVSKKSKKRDEHLIEQSDGVQIDGSKKRLANVLKDKKLKDSQKRKCIETSDSAAVEKIKKKKKKVVATDSSRPESNRTKHKTPEPTNDSDEEVETSEITRPVKVKKKSKKDKKLKATPGSDISSDPRRDEEDAVSPSQKIKSKRKDRKTKVKSGDDLNAIAESDKDSEDEEEMDADVSVTKEEERSDGVEDGKDRGEVEEEDVGFTILGEVEGKSKKKKVKRVLPEWLSQPTVVEHDLTRNQVCVDEYSLISPKIASALKQNNITHLFPVQRHVIPIILDSVKFGLHAGNAGYRPRDVCVSAPTGSGKTLAFAVPIVQALHDRIVPRIRALVVLPTRDLATQVYRVFAMLCNAVGLRVVLLGGQKAFIKEQEMLAKYNHPDGTQIDIVVATPGRLVDHINNTKGFVLEHLRFLVIDEADRMMEQISNDWVSQVEKLAYPGKSAPLGVASILQARPKPGPVTSASCFQMQQPLQKLLFSATLSQNPEKLTHLNLFQPRLVTTLVTHGQGQQKRLKVHQQENVKDEEEVEEETGEFIGKFTTPVGLKEYYIEASKGDKPLIIMHLMKRLYFRQVLCFTNTVEATHRLYLLLKIVGGISVAEFSSNLKSSDRQQILRQFKAGKIDILICSDSMARGMDMDNVRFVISYSLPPYLKTYIHRVGRTARAGKPGIAFSLLQKSEVPHFRSMMKNAGKTGIDKHMVRPGDLQPLMLDYEDALEQLPHILKKEKERS